MEGSSRKGGCGPEYERACREERIVRYVVIGWLFFVVMPIYFLTFSLMPIKWSDRLLSTKLGDKLGNLPGKLYHFAETGSWS